MRSMLCVVFGLILLSMLAVTSYASLDRSILQVGPQLLSDPWFHATLCDAYCGFLTFFVWVAWKERSWLGRAGWFVGIMLLGNIAMSVYVLIQITRLGPDFTPERLLLPERSG